MADTYVVKKGDTLWDIARAYGTTYQKLAEINNIPDPDFIVVGQVLRLTAKPKSETVTATVSNTFSLDVNNLSQATVKNISIPVGEAIRIDKISASHGIFTRLVASVKVNGVTVWSKDQTVGVDAGYSAGPFPSASGYYTSATATNTIQISLRGGASAPSYSSGPTFSMSVKYTTTDGEGVNSSQALINLFGLQANTDRTVYATWIWSKENTDNYQTIWYYDTGNGAWFVGNDSTTNDKQSIYTAPENAKKVKFKVKPLSKTHSVNGSEVRYWVAGWSTAKTYDFSDNPPTTPSAPTVKIDKYKLTAELDNLDVNATSIQFQVVKNDSSVYKSGTAAIKTNHASYSCTVDAGNEYKVRCRAYRDGKYSNWSEYSSNVSTIPATPSGITTCRASSETSVYLAWSETKSAVTYDIEYTTKKEYFDGSDQTTTVTGIEFTHYEKTGLESGQEYFFRVRAVNSNGNSGWSGFKSVVIGKEPAAPTTWSSTTTAVTGDSLTLYWVHNTEDGSSQTFAELELYIDGVKETYTIENTTNEDEKDKTSSYAVDTSEYIEGTKIQWRVRTAGITKVYGDWSVQRTIDIYAPPTLELGVTDSEGGLIETLSSFPFYISGLAGPNTQQPIGYHLTITSNETYETVDYIGNPKIVNTGDQVYSKYFDTSDPLLVEMSASNLDLENNINYTVACVVSMNSGLTTETTYDFTVTWTEMLYEPNAEIGIDEDTFSATIRPFCEKREVKYYRIDNSSDIYSITDETIDEKIESVYTDTGEKVLFGIFDGEEIYYCSKQEEAESEVNYYKVALSSDAYNITSDAVNIEAVTPVYTTSGEQVLMGVSNGEQLFYCMVEDVVMIEGVLLSVYRREFDGSFTELASGLNNMSNTYITDPHPALDYARYRIIATDSSTGAISYYDIPNYPVGGKAVIIQWDEDWTNFSASTEDTPEQPAWAGSLLKLPYNIDVSDNHSSDIALIEYIGRKHPVSYYGTQLGETSTWNVSIEKDDEETLYALRRLAKWMGDVYVREPSGSGYWANITVSFSQKHCQLTIPVTLDIVRVEGGM